MKIRSQLILAFLLLAVLPLATIVLFSYWSSERSIRQATEQEARQLATRLEQLMEDTRGSLKNRFERLQPVPSKRWTAPEIEHQVGAALGDSLGLLEQLTFVPNAPAPPDPPTAADSSTPPATGAAPPALAEEPADDTAHVDPELVIVFRNEETIEGSGAMPPDAAQIAEQVARAKARFEESRRLAIETHQLHEQRAQQELSRTAGEVGARAAEVSRIRHRVLEDLSHEFKVSVRGDGGEIIGQLAAKIRIDLLLQKVLGAADRERGEVPFAIDDDGRVYTQNETDRAALAEIELDPKALATDPEAFDDHDCVLAYHRDERSKLTFWVVRPLGENLAELRHNQLRNFGFGLALVLAALCGILPFTGRLSRHLEQLTEGARRVASGDLQTRVDVHSKSEVGELAQAFNSMAEDLGVQRLQLVREERQRQRQATEQQLLEAAYQRKSQELEEARQFQLSLLPARLPQHPGFEIDVHMQTATEVGGDYYDFLNYNSLGNTPLVAAVGDATGHGARAGTMVTVIKSLLMADGGNSSPRDFLRQANRAVKRMRLERMTMALTLLRLDGHRATLSSAGMPPALIYRQATAKVEEIVLSGLPLGGLDEAVYQQVQVELQPGDSMLLLSDGLPELPDSQGEPFGYQRLHDLFVSCGTGSPTEIVACLVEAARSWGDGEAPPDDVTFVVLRARD